MPNLESIRNFKGNHPDAYRRMSYIPKGIGMTALMVGSVTGINLVVATATSIVALPIIISDKAVSRYVTRKDEHFQSDESSKAEKLKKVATFAKKAVKNTWLVTIPVVGPILYLFKNPPGGGGNNRKLPEVSSMREEGGGQRRRYDISGDTEEGAY